VGFIAYDLNGYPAAFYGIIPMIGKYNGESILIGQSADTLTHPNHQKKGLFVYLANKTYKLAKQEGVKFLYGLPNSNSYPGFINKLNWTYQDDIYIYSISIFQFPFAKIFQLTKVSNYFFKYYIDLITFIFWHQQLNFLNVIKETENNCSIRILYDEIYFGYKKYGGGSKILKVSETSTILFKVKGKLKIGFLSHNINLDSKLKMKLKFFAFFCGCNEIEYKSNFSNKLSNKFFNFRTGSEVITKSLDNDFDNFKIKINYFDFDTF
jgi:hypothetical protein